MPARTFVWRPRTERPRSTLPPAIERWKRCCAVMRRGERGLLVALMAAAAVATGCGTPCGDDPDREAAFDAAWRNDLGAMRGLIARNPGLAAATHCPPPETLLGRLVARQLGGGEQTVLHVAARQGFAELAAMLLAAGAQVNAPDASAETPLHTAAHYGHDDVAAVLLAAGAAVDARRIGGLEPQIGRAHV